MMADRPPVLSEAVEMTAIADLVQHPRNAREGDVGAISESIKANGFYGAVVVQRSTRHILIGNHRVRAAAALGYQAVPVLFVDVDDERALRILLSENRLNELASNNEEAVAKLLAELAPTAEGLAGTGYDADALDDLLADLATAIEVAAPERCPTCGQLVRDAAQLSKMHEALADAAGLG